MFLRRPPSGCCGVIRRLTHRKSVGVPLHFPARVVRGADDARLVVQLCGDDRRLDVDVRQELLRDAADAATDDEQLRTEVHKYFKFQQIIIFFLK